MITTKKISIEYIHKETEEIKAFHYKNQLTTKEGSNGGNRRPKKAIWHVENK